MIKKVVSLLLGICVIMSASSCQQAKLQNYSKVYLEFFDTVSQIIGYEEEEAVFSANCEEIYAMLEEYHMLTDIYHSYEGVNNVRTINENAGKEPVPVDNKLIDLLIFAKDMYKETDGLCNIAMGSVLSIWHKYREAGIDNPVSAELPPMDELTAASEHCSIDDIVIDKESGTVFLTDPDMSLDLGAVAKGYAAERCAELLISKGITNGYTLNIGGNVRAIGTKADGTAWAAGIQNPDTSSDTSYIVRIDASNKSVVTSGNYQRYYYVDGVRYHHIIHPEKLMPVNYFDSVSIICNDSGEADALSTALYNLPVEEGKAMLEKTDGVQAIWILSDGSYVYTEGLASYFL